VAHSYIIGMTDELDDPFITELHGFEGSLFDPAEMERLLREYQQGIWYWHADDQMLMYRSWPLEIILRETRKAAPIAEAIIEQAKEEGFFAWGL